MPTIKCPKCSTMMKLQQQAKAVKVKCPKCGTVLKVAAPKQPAQAAAAKARTAQTAPKQTAPVTPAPTQAAPAQPAPAADPFAAAADPFATSTADPFSAAPAADPFGAAPGQFDFGNLDTPAAPMPAAASPAAAPGNTNPYAKPAQAAAPAKKKRSSKGGNKKLLIGLAIGGGVLLLSLIGVVAFLAARDSGGGSKSASSSPSSSSAASPAAPTGTGSVGRVSFTFPEGSSMDTPPTTITAQAHQSTATGATYFVGIDEYEFLNPSPGQIALRAGRMILSNVYGGQKVERNGHAGIKGNSRGGLYFTDMTVEYFMIDDQIIVVGCGMPRRKFEKPKVINPPPPPPPTEEELRKAELFVTESKAFFDTVSL